MTKKKIKKTKKLIKSKSTKSIVYLARVGAPFKKEKAQKIGEAIKQIKEKHNGELDLTVALEEIEEQKTPELKILYDELEWNDSVCGVQYRLQQLRNITNHIVEEIIVGGEPILQRSFLSVENDTGDNVYVSREVAIENINYKKQILKRMIATSENLTQDLKIFLDEE